jgi:hypothetical protein
LSWSCSSDRSGSRLSQWTFPTRSPIGVPPFARTNQVLPWRGPERDAQKPVRPVAGS